MDQFGGAEGPQRPRLLAQRERRRAIALAFANRREPVDRDQPFGRLGDDLFEERRGLLPVATARVVQCQVGPDVGATAER